MIRNFPHVYREKDANALRTYSYRQDYSTTIIVGYAVFHRLSTMPICNFSWLTTLTFDLYLQEWRSQLNIQSRNTSTILQVPMTLRFGLVGLNRKDGQTDGWEGWQLPRGWTI